MADERYSIELSGCAPIPLASYLKALGILRLVAEQVDQRAQGWWEGDTFWLRSTLDRGGLVEFFLERYAPTPLVGPWGARSGFYAGSPEKSAREALDAILDADDPRFLPFQTAVSAVKAMMEKLGTWTKPDDDASKLRLMMACRSQLPDELIPWFDATFVLLNDGRSYPPLLGTGGNEGSGSYFSGFSQQVVDALLLRRCDHALPACLYGSACSNSHSAQTPGHFSPEALGGANASTGFEADATTNPWDYLLLLEGTLYFGSACAKKLESNDAASLVFPFCVRPTGVGYASSTLNDERKSKKAKRSPVEMWFPLWERPTGSSELQQIFSEGRVQIGRRTVGSGIDFARAVTTLGTDRGISSFQRFGFLERNGPTLFAAPLGRFRVRFSSSVESLLSPIDGWLDRFRHVASSANAPTRAGRALRQLQSAIFELCQRGRRCHVQDVLIALGQGEAAVALSPKLRDHKEKTYVSPLPQLSSKWLAEAYVGSQDVEFRLAAALAGIGWRKEDKVGPFRRHIEPIDPNTWHSPWPKWNKSADDPSLVWGGGSLVQNMLGVLNRRMIDAVGYGKQSGADELLFPGKGRCYASLGDIAAFIGGGVDDRRIELLLRGLILVNWHDSGIFEAIQQFRGLREPMPDAGYALLKLCHVPHKIAGKAVRLTPAITRRASSGDLTEATRLAATRLNASGLPPAVDLVHGRGEHARRITAALLFPVWHKETAKETDVTRLMDVVLRTGDPAEAAGNASADV